MRAGWSRESSQVRRRGGTSRGRGRWPTVAAWWPVRRRARQRARRRARGVPRGCRSRCARPRSAPGGLLRGDARAAAHRAVVVRAVSATSRSTSEDLGTGRIDPAARPGRQRRLGRHLPLRGLRPRRDRPRARSATRCWPRSAGRWLTEALDAHGAGYHAASGTVTCVATESFGGMADEDGTAQLEIRASWTPVVDERRATST